MSRSRAVLFVFAVLCNVLTPLAWAEEAAPPAAVLPPEAAERAELALIAARARHAPLTVFAPTTFPDALPAGQATDVKFTVLVVGGAAGFQPPVSLQIRGIEAQVPMHDDGLGPDLSAGDHIYSGVARFEAADATAGRCYGVRARARSAGGRTVLSSERRLCVTRFPVGFAASDLSESNIILYDAGGFVVRVVADEALILVSPDLSDDQIAMIASSVKGEVVGSLPSLDIYQIRLRTSQTAEELRETIVKLESTEGVLFAAPNEVGVLSAPPVAAVSTSDPLLGSQWGLERINARKAWSIATGDPLTLIAVIDTGVDFDHPDFWATPSGTDTRFATDGSGNLVAADCVSGSCVTVTKPATCHATNSCNLGNAAADTHGHGTLVAGLIGAAADNALGVAGVNWQARLLAVRYANSGTVSASALLNGINYARAQGARILSISSALVGFTAGILCPTVAAADGEGRLVVAAAGNDGGTGKSYPAGCAGAMPVANSEVNVSEVIPNPILVFDHMETGPNFEGTPVDRYHFTVANYLAYPNSMFQPRPDLPPCGLNTSASQTWVDFFSGDDNSRIYGFCALGQPSDLNLLWFGVIPSGTAPPLSVYITLTDRETGIVYRSNTVPVPFP